MSSERSMAEISAALGAGQGHGTKVVTMFVPSVERDSKPIDQEHWRKEALSVLGRLFGGATAFPPGLGVWRDDGRGGTLVFDDTAVLVCYARESDLTDGAFVELRAFLHRLGRETNQGEVGIVIDGAYLPITEYDEGGHG